MLSKAEFDLRTRVVKDGDIPSLTLWGLSEVELACFSSHGQPMVIAVVKRDGERRAALLGLPWSAGSFVQH